MLAIHNPYGIVDSSRDYFPFPQNTTNVQISQVPKKGIVEPTDNRKKRITQGRAGNRTRVARTRSAHTTPILLSRAGVSQEFGADRKTDSEDLWFWILLRSLRLAV